jgi:hypothetical protein
MMSSLTSSSRCDLLYSACQRDAERGHDTGANQFEMHDSLLNTSAQCVVSTPASKPRAHDDHAIDYDIQQSWKPPSMVRLKKSLGGRIETSHALRSLMQFPLSAGRPQSMLGR